MWNGRTPTVRYFKEFGSKIICLDKTPNTEKIDVRLAECIFVGLSVATKISEDLNYEGLEISQRSSVDSAGDLGEKPANQV